MLSPLNWVLIEYHVFVVKIYVDIFMRSSVKGTEVDFYHLPCLDSAVISCITAASPKCEESYYICSVSIYVRLWFYT